jgi:hypothetical protein
MGWSDRSSDAMNPADHVLAALSRASFILGLAWRSPGANFEAQEAADGVRVSDAFVFDEPPASPADTRWIAMQATAANGPESSGPVTLSLMLAAPGSVTARLRMVNEINRQAAAPVHFDEQAAALVVRAGILYAGYHQHERDLAHCRREATLNLFIGAFATAQQCLARLGDEVSP